MTRKHFDLIAAVIRERVEASPNVGGHTHQRDIAYGLADEFAAINSNFNAEQFLTACGVSK